MFEVLGVLTIKINKKKMSLKIENFNEYNTKIQVSKKTPLFKDLKQGYLSLKPLIIRKA